MNKFEWIIQDSVLDCIECFVMYTDGEKKLKLFSSSEKDLRNLRRAINRYLREKKNDSLRIS